MGMIHCTFPSILACEKRLLHQQHVSSTLVICLSSYTQRRQFLLKVLVYYCFLVFHRIGEYISLDLFYLVSNFKCLIVDIISLIQVSDQMEGERKSFTGRILCICILISLCFFYFAAELVNRVAVFRGQDHTVHATQTGLQPDEVCPLPPSRLSHDVRLLRSTAHLLPSRTV